MTKSFLLLMTFFWTVFVWVIGILIFLEGNGWELVITPLIVTGLIGYVFRERMSKEHPRVVNGGMEESPKLAIGSLLIMCAGMLTPYIYNFKDILDQRNFLFLCTAALALLVTGAIVVYKGFKVGPVYGWD